MSPAHGHVPTGATGAGRNERRLQLVVGVTALYLVADVVGGLLTKSLAPLADAGLGAGRDAPVNGPADAAIRAA